MSHALAVFIGGGLGALARYGVGRWTLAWFGADFPWGTLAVNVAGSLVIGLLALRIEAIDSLARIFLVIGFLGGFTTFSAFSAETMQMWLDGAQGKALAYVLISISASLCALWVGIMIR